MNITVKHIGKIALGALCVFSLAFASCEDYLERTPDSNLDEGIIFGKYANFQGYIDEMYGSGLIPYIRTGGSPWTAAFDFGDDVYSNQKHPPAYAIARGDYMWLYENQHQNPFMDFINGGKFAHEGLWHQAWRNIRRCNEGLINMNRLADATEDQKKWLEGQMYFFRAWNHFEVAKFWGGVPYVDVLLGPNDNLKLARLSYRETLLKVVADLEKAAELLPVEWHTPTINTGRVTKGAAYALIARAYLYAASPLTSRMEGQGAVYDQELCKKAAEFAYKVIDLKKQGGQKAYTLMPWDKYENIWTETSNGTDVVYSTETIFQKIHNNKGGQNQVENGLGRIHTSMRFGGNNVCTFPTVNFVNLYEMSSGHPLGDEDIPAGLYKEKTPWANRDPRLRKTILTDGVLWAVNADPAKNIYTQLYFGGLDCNADNSLSGYLIRKYLPFRVNRHADQTDKTYWDNFRFSIPFLRLSEMYLTFAEAANEAWGPNVKPTFEDGVTASISAVDAVNTIRRRVMLPVSEDISLPAEMETYGTTPMPDVLPKFTASTDTFRERIRNERSVELAFEGHRWHDIRRWYVAHQDKYKVRYRAVYDKDHNNYSVEPMFTAMFDDKHYWFPFRRSDVEQYMEFEQNPGW